MISRRTKSKERITEWLFIQAVFGFTNLIRKRFLITIYFFSHTRRSDLSSLRWTLPWWSHQYRSEVCAPGGWASFYWRSLSLCWRLPLSDWTLGCNLRSILAVCWVRWSTASRPLPCVPSAGPWREREDASRACSSASSRTQWTRWLSELVGRSYRSLCLTLRSSKQSLPCNQCICFVDRQQGWSWLLTNLAASLITWWKGSRPYTQSFCFVELLVRVRDELAYSWPWMTSTRSQAYASPVSPSCAWYHASSIAVSGTSQRFVCLWICDGRAWFYIWEWNPPNPQGSCSSSKIRYDVVRAWSPLYHELATFSVTKHTDICVERCCMGHEVL